MGVCGWVGLGLFKEKERKHTQNDGKILKQPLNQLQQVALMMSQATIWVSQMAILLTKSTEQPSIAHVPAIFT